MTDTEQLCERLRKFIAEFDDRTYWGGPTITPVLPIDTVRQAAALIQSLTIERDEAVAQATRMREALEAISVARSALDGGSVEECRRTARVALSEGVE